jgi:hypothetical protein
VVESNSCLVFDSRDQCLRRLEHGFSGWIHFSRQFFGLQFGGVRFESSRRQCWSRSDPHRVLLDRVLLPGVPEVSVVAADFNSFAVELLISAPP